MSRQKLICFRWPRLTWFSQCERTSYSSFLQKYGETLHSEHAYKCWEEISFSVINNSCTVNHFSHSFVYLSINTLCFFYVKDHLLSWARMNKISMYSRAFHLRNLNCDTASYFRQQSLNMWKTLACWIKKRVYFAHI